MRVKRLSRVTATRRVSHEPPDSPDSHPPYTLYIEHFPDHSMRDAVVPDGEEDSAPAWVRKHIAWALKQKR